MTALLVEPDRDFAATLERNLDLLHCRVGGVCGDARSAIEIISERPIDVVFIDQGIGGAELAFLTSQLAARELPFLVVGPEGSSRQGRNEPIIHRDARPDRIASGISAAMEKVDRKWPSSAWETVAESKHRSRPDEHPLFGE